MPYLQVLNPWNPHPCGDEPTGEFISIPFEIIRSSRKTMALQIAPDGHLVMRLPRRLPEKEAFKFAMSHEGWIGRNYRKVTEQKRERPVYGEEEIRAFIEKLRPVLEHRVSYYASLMKVDYGRITIRNQKTRWGSCSVDSGRIRLNKRLALYPDDCLEYVIVHELCHLLEPSHNERFKMLMSSFMPDWKERKKRLGTG